MTNKQDSPSVGNSSSHRLLLQNRAAMELTGVEDVISFDETGAVLRTVLGMLAVDGENLHVVKLDLAGGSVQIEGKINGLFYSDGAAKKASKRLFRGC